MFCIVQIVSFNEIFIFNIKGPSTPMCFAGVVAAIFTYIEIAALRVLAISEDFLRYVNELGSGVLRNHYIINVRNVFVFFFRCGRCRAECRDLLRNVEGQGMKKNKTILLRESTLKPKEVLLLFINECQLNFWNQVIIEAIVT